MWQTVLSSDFLGQKRCDFGARTRQFSDLHDCSVISTYLNMERATPSTSSKWGAILKSFGIYCRLYWQPTSFPVSAHYFPPKFYGKVKLWNFFSCFNQEKTPLPNKHDMTLKFLKIVSIEAKSKVEKHKQSIRFLIRGIYYLCYGTFWLQTHFSSFHVSHGFQVNSPFQCTTNRNSYFLMISYLIQPIFGKGSLHKQTKNDILMIWKTILFFMWK